MKRLSLNEYEEQAKSADRINYVGRILNEHREGIYMSLRKGMTYSVYFIGHDVKAQKFIIEDVT